MQVGDLVKFDYVYANYALNGQLAVYLGEDFIHRDDGATIENHKVLLMGAAKPTIIDRGLVSHMKTPRTWGDHRFLFLQLAAGFPALWCYCFFFFRFPRKN